MARRLNTWFGLLLCNIAAVCASTVNADQALWNNQAIVDKADKILDYGIEVRHFCPPCGDKTYRREIVAGKETSAVDTPGQFELLINGEAVDLAYVYVEKDGKWSNVAKLVGATVDGVPELLPETVPAGLPDFDRVKYVGKIDGRLAITVELSKFEQDLNGTYYYSHIGQALNLTGTVDGVGAFTLDESDSEGQKTGLFTGKILDRGARAEGTWANLDGTKTLSFALNRVALHGDESGGMRVGSQGTEVHLDFPVFLSSAGPGYTALNAAIQRTLRGRAMEYTQQFVESSAELGLDDPTQMDGEYSQTISVGDNQILFLNDSVASILFLVTLYQGGAHGMTMNLPFNVRLVKEGEAYTAKPITLADLLAPGEEALGTLSSYAIEALKKKNASLVVDGQIKVFKAEDLAAFTLSPRGIMIYFDPYAVASYAEGAFEVFVPFADLPAVFNAEAIGGIADPK